MTNREIAQEISSRIGNSPVPFDSVYSIALQIYNELGGDETQFDSVYSILLEILPLVEGGGGGKAIEEVSELPNASENKDKLFRLDNGEKDIYAAKLLSSETITTNRLPDEQQIDKAYLYLADDVPFYYKGAYKIVCTDGEIEGYGWLETYSDNDEWYLYLTKDNAVEVTENTECISISFEDAEIDEVNKTVTVDDIKESWDYSGDNLIGNELIPIPAIYNAPEANQIGNAYIEDNDWGLYFTYTGESVQITYNGDTINGYKFYNSSDDVYIVSTKKASEMYYSGSRTSGGFIFDFKLYYLNNNVIDGECTENYITTMNIPQLNAPDSEQVGNATIYDGSSEVTLTYTGNEVTLTASNGIFTCYLWEHVEDNMILLTNANATNAFSNTIYYWAENGDIVKIDDTHYEAQSDGLDSVGTSSLSEDGYEISTVKYQRTEVTEEWDWQPLTDNATDADIDAMFEDPIGGTITLIREQDSEQQAAGFVDWWVNTEGETMEYEGGTYYKWVSWSTGEGDTEPTEHPNYVMLTNTLDITLPFNVDSPEYEYTIYYNSEEGTWGGDGTYFHGDYTQKTVQ